MTRAGFPIRTSPDHSSVANSPGLIAGSYVLHRLLMPRHPPYALHSLSPHTQTQQKQDTPTPLPKGERRGILSKTATKMLASTIQQPNNHKKTSNHTPIQVLAPDFSGPNSAPPNPPEGEPAPVSWTCRPFHTRNPCKQEHE